MANDMHCFRDDHALWREIEAARFAAHEKHGVNSIEKIHSDDPGWLAILVEEVGEIANTMTYDANAPAKTRAELIDVLAVASAWVDRIDRDHGRG